MGVSIGKVIALTDSFVKSNPNPLNVPSSYVFADTTARDSYFSINYSELENNKTYIYIENTNTLETWSGDTNPLAYDNLFWVDKTGFIKGDKGDSGSVGQGVNTGGATNQVLKKLSPADYDTDWGNITNAPNNSILIASGGDLADSGKRFNDLGITVADIWSANKVISQIDSQVAKTLSIEGNWNASTNTPNLDGISEGDTYIVEVAGTNYGDTYEVNDWIVKTDTGYAKINNNLATVVFSAIGGSPLDNPELILEFDKYINKISTISTGNIPKITADGQIEDSTYSVSDLFTKDLTEYTEKTTTLSNNDKVLVFDESTGLWKYSRVDRIPSSNSSTLKVSDTDIIEGYLIDKLIGTTNYIILTKVNAGAEEQIQIEIGSNVFDKSTNTTDDLTEGTTNLLLTQTERTLIGVLVNNGDGLSYLTNDGTYKRVSWGDIDGILSNQTDLQDVLNLKEDTANKNKANGYVGLDANAKIDISYIPNAALERLIIVADETARFALTTTVAQNGDVVKQQDIDIMFYIVDDTNLSNSSGYEEFAVGTAGAVEWSNILNKPTDIFYTEVNTTDDLTEGNTNLFDKEVVFTGGNNVTITGTYPNFEIQDNTMSQTDIQNALGTKLNSADNLTDVADQQTALNNITAVSGATDEYVLTKDTTTGNAQWKVSSDELTKVSANDTTAGYLEDKIVGTTNKITVTTLDDGSNEDLQIDIGTDIFDKSINTMDDVTDGTTYVKTENNLTDTLKTNYNSAYTHSTTTTGNPHSVTKTDVGLGNVVNVDTSNPANITWTESYRTVTDTDKTTWNGKQNALGYTAENSANKKTVWQATPDNTSYPSEKLVKDSIDLKVDKVTGKQLSTEDYTTAEKTKLSGIATGANNYVHPTGDGNSHIPVTGITNNGKILKAGATANSASWGNVDWSEVANKPTTFTPTAHNHTIPEITNLQTSLDAKVNASDVVTTATANKILKLDENAKLPASITGNADGNSATATKLQTAKTINGVSFDGSENITINAVDSTSRIASTEKGAVNGVATLDTAGRVPSSQLPSYVDDVLEYANVVSFPATGEASKIYVALDVNLAYRWGGSNYVEISPSIALGETSSTAYRGDRGASAYTHSILANGSNPHSTTFANIASKPTTLSGYGITDSVPKRCMQSSINLTANTWYRIAASAIDIDNCHGTFKINWATPSYHGNAVFDATAIFGTSLGSTIQQQSFSIYKPLGGFIEARVVYNTYYTGNYAYVEVKSGSSIESIQIIVSLTDSLGWTLLGSITEGSIPTGYTSYIHTFTSVASITSGTYPKVTINQEGRVISGSNLSASDIPVLDWSKITTGKPITLSGYGIKDAVDTFSAQTIGGNKTFDGAVKIAGLTGTGNRMVVADSTGNLSASSFSLRTYITATAGTPVIVGDINTFRAESIYEISVTGKTASLSGEYEKIMLHTDADGNPYSRTIISGGTGISIGIGGTGQFAISVGVTGDYIVLITNM